MESKKTPTRFRWFRTTVFVCAIIAGGLLGLSQIAFADDPLPPAPVLVSPAEHANLYDLWTPYTLDWAETQYAETYRVELSEQSDFSSLYDYADGLTETEWDTPSISVGIFERNFYWRVRASNVTGDGPWSTPRHFWVHRSKAWLISPIGDVTNQDSLEVAWHGVEEGFSYRVIIDNSPLFISPEKDTTIWCSDFTCYDYITPPLPSNTRYYWKVKSYTPYFWSMSDVKSFFLESPGGGASCPVLFSFDGNDFVRENPLLTACEQSNYTEVVTDYYHLTEPIAPRGGTYVFQLRETENEMTYLRDIELITVDHSTESTVGCAVDGRIFTYSESVTPLSAVDNTGVGRLDALVAADDNMFVATGPGHLVLTFPNPLGDAYVDFTAPGKEPCPFEDPGPPPPKTVADGDRPSAPLKVEVMNENGEWVEMPDIPSRENPTQEFILSSMELPAEIDFIIVRISWKDGFSADVIRQYVPADETPEIKTWEVSSGNLFTADPLPKAWPGFDNGVILELVKGDVLEFEFNVNQPLPSGQTRDFIIRAVGRYQPDYSVFTHLVPGQFQLYDNHPNPFNIQTEIAYDLPAATRVKLEIYNMLGRHVVTLVDGQQNFGHYQVEWNGQDKNGQTVSSGLYVYRLTAAGFDQSKKMMLLK